MIISHKHRFIFLKTFKTAGSSIEYYLAQYCGPEDIIIPMNNEKDCSYARNWKGFIARHVLQTPLKKKGFFQKLKALRHYLILKEIAAAPPVYNQQKASPALVYLLDICGHMGAIPARHMIGEKIWNEYFVFCVERNTWERLVSFYLWKKRDLQINKKGELSFADFINNPQNKKHNFHFYADSSGRLMVDRILRFENLDEEMEQVCQKLGLPFENWKKSKRLKVSRYPDGHGYRHFYTEQQKELVAKDFAGEIAFMNYTF